MTFGKMVSASILLLLSADAFAQDAKPAVKLWDQGLVDACIDGVNLSTAVKVVDPDRAAGSVFYQTEHDGVKAFDLFPLGLPLVAGTPTAAEKPVCDLELRTTGTVSGEVLGVAKVGGGSDKLYHIVVRQVGQKRVDYIVEDNLPRTPWNSKKYFPLLQSALFSKPSKAWGIDVVNIYLVTVEQFDKVNGDIKGGWGIVTANGNFSKNSAFNVSKIVLTGQAVPLDVASITQKAPAVASVPLPAIGTSAILATSDAASASLELRKEIQKSNQ